MFGVIGVIVIVQRGQVDRPLGAVDRLDGCGERCGKPCHATETRWVREPCRAAQSHRDGRVVVRARGNGESGERSEEHTSELQSLMRISYAVFCLKKKKTQYTQQHSIHSLNALTYSMLL